MKEECSNPRLVCIRIENASEVDFQSFSVGFERQTESSYGPLVSGGVSEYRKINWAHTEVATEGFSGERRFILPVLDFVSGPYLQPGAYTYRYTASPFSKPMVIDDRTLDGYLGLELVSDDY